MRFYTTPPKTIEHPYLMVNPRTRKILYKRSFDHAILDCGVEYFAHNPEVTDYPKSLLKNWGGLAQIQTRNWGNDIWVTIPDYPDDLNKGQFGDNVSKTLENVEKYLSVDNVNWIVTIQSRLHDVISFYESLQRTRQLVGKNYPRIAIGTVCKSRKKKFIITCMKAARKHFPDSHIHAFGVTLSYLPEISNFIDSFDTMAWNFPRTRFKQWSQETGLRPFPNGKIENLEYFWNRYIDRLNELGVLENMGCKE